MTENAEADVRLALRTYERRDVSETCVGELSQVQLDGDQAARVWQIKEPNADRRSCASSSSHPESLPFSLWGVSPSPNWRAARI